ncbi:MAG: YncE family protein [Pseudomonadota bacterium]|nr:YncE family protein [Pseudomonadota bacterium]
MKDSRWRGPLLVGWLTALPLLVMGGTEVYVPLGSANAIAVVDADADRVVAEIPEVNASHGLAVSWDGRYLVAGSLLEHPKGDPPPKPKDMSEEEHASHHASPKGASAKALGKAQSSGMVYLIDAKARRILRHIDVPGAVHHALVTPDGHYAVVTHPGRGSVSIIDIHGHKLHKELPTGLTPNYVVTKRDGTRVYVSNAGDGTISEIDPVEWTVLRKLPAGKTPEHLVLSPDERYLYAANPTVGTVSRIDLELGEVTQRYGVGGEPHGVDLSDDGRLLYASNKADNKLVVFNLASDERRSVTLVPAPYHVATVRGTGKVYVSSRKEPKIWVLDQQTLAVRGEIPIRGEGHEMGVINR